MLVNSSLETFICFYGQTDGQNVVKLSLVNKRYATVIREVYELRCPRLSFTESSRANALFYDDLWQTAVTLSFISDVEKKEELSVFVANYDCMAINLVGIRNIFAMNPNHEFHIHLSLSFKTIPWVTTKMAERIPLLIRNLFPSSKLILNRTEQPYTGEYPEVYRQLLPFVCKIAPYLTEATCCVEDLPYLDDVALERLEVIEPWFNSNLYDSPMFRIRARELICTEVFPITFFHQGRYPVQPQIEILETSVCHKEDIIPGQYEAALNEIPKCCPRLKLLRLIFDQTLHQLGCGQTCVRNGFLDEPCLDEFCRIVSHVQQIAHFSNVKTEVEVRFQKYVCDYAGAATELLMNLLPITRISTTTDRRETSFIYEHRKTVTSFTFYSWKLDKKKYRG
uniref:F-box domain-containing protein n=1 Tax=Bursaphelenchus xylophilus TaxID=6326 RepID=A0A1I7SV23_BURXY